MSDITPMPHSPFDAIKHTDEQGEYWLDRELAKTLEYHGSNGWQNFVNVIEKAKMAFIASGGDVERNYIDINIISSDITKRGPKVKAKRMTREFCYVVAMNAETSKPIVGQAQRYFAQSTIRQEQQSLEQWGKHTVAEIVNNGYSIEYAKLRILHYAQEDQWEHEIVIRDVPKSAIPRLKDLLHRVAFGCSIEEHKEAKGFMIKVRVVRGKEVAYHPDPLPDALTPRELAVSTVAYATATLLHIENDSHGTREIERDIKVAAPTIEAYKAALPQSSEPLISRRDMRVDKDGGVFGALKDTTEDGEQ